MRKFVASLFIAVSVLLSISAVSTPAHAYQTGGGVEVGQITDNTYWIRIHGVGVFICSNDSGCGQIA